MLRWTDTDISGIYSVVIGQDPQQHLFAVNVPAINEAQQLSESDLTRTNREDLQKTYPEWEVQVVTEPGQVVHCAGRGRRAGTSDATAGRLRGALAARRVARTDPGGGRAGLAIRALQRRRHSPGRKRPTAGADEDGVAVARPAVVAVGLRRGHRRRPGARRLDRRFPGFLAGLGPEFPGARRRTSRRLPRERAVVGVSNTVLISGTLAPTSGWRRRWPLPSPS